MTFQEMQDGIMKVAETYSERFGVVIDQDFAILKLHEEVSEFAKAVLIYRKQSRPEKLPATRENKSETACWFCGACEFRY